MSSRNSLCIKAYHISRTTLEVIVWDTFRGVINLRIWCARCMHVFSNKDILVETRAWSDNIHVRMMIRSLIMEYDELRSANQASKEVELFTFGVLVRYFVRMASLTFDGSYPSLFHQPRWFLFKGTK